MGQHFNCGTGRGGAILWEPGAMYDLNTLIPPNSGLQLDNAFAISDRGEIAGFGLPPGCTLDTLCGHAFVLIPCEKEHSNDDGCEAEDATTTAIQEHPSVANKILSSRAEVKPESSGNRERVRAIFPRKSSLRAWPQK